MYLQSMNIIIIIMTLCYSYVVVGAAVENCLAMYLNECEQKTLFVTLTSPSEIIKVIYSFNSNMNNGID